MLMNSLEHKPNWKSEMKLKERCKIQGIEQLCLWWREFESPHRKPFLFFNIRLDVLHLSFWFSTVSILKTSWTFVKYEFTSKKFIKKSLAIKETLKRLCLILLFIIFRKYISTAMQPFSMHCSRNIFAKNNKE
jgi:hypothetical protein